MRIGWIYCGDFSYFGFESCVTLMPSRNLPLYTI
jgi:hypothetical protein